MIRSRHLREAVILILAVAVGGGSGRASTEGDSTAPQTPGAPPAGDNAAEEEGLRRALLERDRAFLERDAKLVAAKYARMARTQFAFFRGTRWLAVDESSALASGASSRIALTGDPHPENVAIDVERDGSRALRFNDFDLAHYGSFTDDLRRLAVGIWIVADMADLKRKQRERAVGELVDGYVAEVRALAAKEHTRPGAIAREKAGHLDAVTVTTSHDSSNAIAASLSDLALARRVLSQIAPERANSAPSPSIKAVVRQNAGVASFALRRLQVSLDDGSLIEIKESIGPSAQVTTTIENQFRRPAITDRFFGWAALDGREYRVRTITPGQRISAERLARELKAGRWSKADLAEFSFALGGLLAHGHCSALDRDGAPGLAAIDVAITSPEQLRSETIAYAGRAAAANKTHLRLFRRALSEHGLALGWKQAASINTATPQD